MRKGVSLHIGINNVDPAHYEGWEGSLVACEADAEDMEAIADSQNFTTHRLWTAKATRSAVFAALHEFGDSLVEGDMLFLTYAGHGGQVPDLNDDEPDGRDETWCLYDGELIDDELYSLFARFKPGVRVFVLSDSCHSGSVIRDMFVGALRERGVLAAMTGGGESGEIPAIRAMPAPLALRVYRKHRNFYDNLQRQIQSDIKQRIRANVLLISGCQDNQTSSDGTFNGLFTANLLRVWNKGRYRGSYRKFHQSIVQRMPPVQTPNYDWVGPSNPEFERQIPLTL